MDDVSNLSIRGLSHVYTSARRPIMALSNVNLEVQGGEFLSIIGPSGGGKTTLLRAAGGLLEPTEGTVHVGGLSPEEAQRRKAIGFVSQDPSLLPWRTVLQNVLLPLQLNHRPGQKDESEAEPLLSNVGLAEFRDHYPHQLSSGMKQRLAFARALVMDPTVLLLDEPLAALDEITRTAMRYELLQLWENSGKTVVLVTHSVPEAIIMSDRVVVMSGRPGRILELVPIELPRPREESLEDSSLFIDYAGQIRETLSLGASIGASPLKAWARN